MVDKRPIGHSCNRRESTRVFHLLAWHYSIYSNLSVHPSAICSGRQTAESLWFCIKFPRRDVPTTCTACSSFIHWANGIVCSARELVIPHIENSPTYNQNRTGNTCLNTGHTKVGDVGKCHQWMLELQIIPHNFMMRGKKKWRLKICGKFALLWTSMLAPCKSALWCTVILLPRITKYTIHLSQSDNNDKRINYEKSRSTWVR